MIPYPHAAENHQYYNAKTIEDSGAGIIIEEKDLTYDKLKCTVEELLGNESKLDNMRKNAKKSEMKNAISNIMSEINKIVK